MAPLLQKPLALAGLSAGLGLASHLAYFIHGEHHNQAPTYAMLCFAVPILLFVGQLHYLDAKTGQAALTTTIIYVSYFTALWTSITVYRVYFHRLNHFPGPFIAKISKLYHVYHIISRSNNHLVVDQWHQKYGPFVQTGPCEISIAHPDGPMAILGPGSKCIKAPWYDQGLPMTSMHTARDRAGHDKRRKVWETGFTTKALRNYEGRVVRYAHALIDQLSRFAGEPVDATKWMAFYGFDVMGDLAFGRSFEMLETGKKHFALKIMHDGQATLGFMSPVPWLMPILIRIPGVMADFNSWVKWSVEQVEERRKMEVPEPDVMTWLLEASKVATNQKDDANWLSGDSRLLIVAGSDTSAVTMTNVLYHLAKDPQIYSKLRAEIKQLVPSTAAYTVSAVRDAPFLNGCINEALRIHPPVPSMLYRITPPEGIKIGDTYIPGGVTVSSPQYTLGKSEDCYVHAREFIPERWYSRPELMLTKEAFAPFSLGPYGCIGKQLAYIEIRTVLTFIISNFNIRFAPGEDGTNLIKNTKDMFTVALGDLRLVFDRVE